MKIADGKPSAKFLEFWKEVYDGGKKKVSNPNQATKKTHPNVSASTAMKTPAFQAKVKKEFKAWLEEEYDGEEDEEKEEEEEEKRVTMKVESPLYQENLSQILNVSPNSKN